MGVAIRYFNNPEFNHDGGDCCESRICISGDLFATSGKDRLAEALLTFAYYYVCQKYMDASQYSYSNAINNYYFGNGFFLLTAASRRYN